MPRERPDVLVGRSRVGGDRYQNGGNVGVADGLGAQAHFVMCESVFEYSWVAVGPVKLRRREEEVRH